MRQELPSLNTDIQVGEVPSWLRSSSSCILRARMSDTVVLRSSDDSITAGDTEQCITSLTVKNSVTVSF